jgi:hypothetical protein
MQKESSVMFYMLELVNISPNMKILKMQSFTKISIMDFQI